jgi:pyruvate decarboxylase
VTPDLVADIRPPLPCQVPYESVAVHTPAELEALLTNEAFAKDDKIRLVEVYMPRGDAPEGLIRQAKLTAEANEKASEK